MSEKKLNDVLLILNKYINNYYNCDFIDYYGLFEIDRNSDLDEINNRINKLKRKLHSDLTMYLPEIFRSYYIELISVFGEFEKIFTNEILKKKYDEDLKKVKKSENTTSDNENDVSKEELDIVSNALKVTSLKHGLAFTIRNILDTFNDFDDYKWDVRFSRETRSGLKKIGKERFKYIISSFSLEKELNEAIINCFSHLYLIDEDMHKIMYPFEAVCFDTLDTYTVLDTALLDYIKDNRVDGFTNKHGFCDMLKCSSIRNSDVVFFIKIYLNTFKEQDDFYEYRNLKRYSLEILVSLFSMKFEFDKEKSKEYFLK